MAGRGAPRVLNIAEKPSVARELAAILSNNQAHRRQGRSQYNQIFEFPYVLNGQNVQMVVTSVSGHLMELRFVGRCNKEWKDVPPQQLFDVPIIKEVSKVRDTHTHTLALLSLSIDRSSAFLYRA
jgi:DNA topoisomerase III